MFDYHKAADEILHVGLYHSALQDALNTSGKSALAYHETVEILKNNPLVLDEYKRINLENNISNIHLDGVDESHEYASEINQNISILRELEKYKIPFDHSPIITWIMSAEFFLLFSVQYLIVLLDLAEWQIPIYSFFALSIVAAFVYAKKMKRIYAERSAHFDLLYKQTEIMLKSQNAPS